MREEVQQGLGLGAVVPGGSAPPAGGHDEAAGAAAAGGASRELGGEGAQVSQVPGCHGAGGAAGRDVTVQHVEVHHGLLALLTNSTGIRNLRVFLTYVVKSN